MILYQYDVESPWPGSKLSRQPRELEVAGYDYRRFRVEPHEIIRAWAFALTLIAFVLAVSLSGTLG